MADNEKMAEQNDLKVLLQQWKESGLSVDEFCKKYLAENGVENPDEVLCRIDAQFERIETHYANIKKMKENGGPRAEKANAFEGLAEAIKANTLNILQEEYTVKEK